MTESLCITLFVHACMLHIIILSSFHICGTKPFRAMLIILPYTHVCFVYYMTLYLLLIAFFSIYNNT